MNTWSELGLKARIARNEKLVNKSFDTKMMNLIILIMITLTKSGNFGATFLR